jgi:hypothetical protein
MNESGFWKWLSKNGRLPSGHYVRIESPSSPGVPDVNFSLDDKTSHGWIELKIGAPGTYPFKRIRHGLRPAQAIFIKERVHRGTVVLVIAYIAPAVAVYRLKTSQVDTFNSLDRDALQQLAVLWVPRRSFRGIDPDLLRP